MANSSKILSALHANWWINLAGLLVSFGASVVLVRAMSKPLYAEYGAVLAMIGLAMLVFDFGAVLYGINYLALRQAITPDRLLGRMTATMRFLTVAPAPLGSLCGGALATVIGLRGTLLTVGVLGLVLAAAAVMCRPCGGTGNCLRLRPTSGGCKMRVARPS